MTGTAPSLKQGLGRKLERLRHGVNTLSFILLDALDKSTRLPRRRQEISIIFRRHISYPIIQKKQTKKNSTFFRVNVADPSTYWIATSSFRQPPRPAEGGRILISLLINFYLEQSNEKSLYNMLRITIDVALSNSWMRSRNKDGK